VGEEDRGGRSALLGLLGVLLLACFVSLLLGSHPISPTRVWDVMLHPDGTLESAVVREQRLPRTVLAVVVGAALGLAGALMQALTRNPIADPGILGVNAGAALLVVLAVAVAGTAGVAFYLWFALVGAAVAAVGVHVLAGTGRPSLNPARLALAGVAVSAALTALTQTVILADQEAFNEFRAWVTGSLEGRGWPVLLTVLPILALGAGLGLLVAPALGILALGDDAAHGLGVRVARTRALAMAAVTLLCGAATAAVGPIAFVGLAVPMLARGLYGHRLRKVCLGSVVLGAAWLLVADTLGRVLIAPQEVPAGVVAAIAGAPIFVAVVRRPTVPSL
jgi:ABC-type Fe3+-siderophore transport system permease subunit